MNDLPLIEVIQFFIDYGFGLLNPPVSGSLVDVYNLCCNRYLKQEGLPSFIDKVDQINSLSSNSLVSNIELSLEECFLIRFVSINKLSLSLLLDQLKGVIKEKGQSQEKAQTLIQILEDKPGDDLESATTRKSQLLELNELLHVSSNVLNLKKEKIKLISTMKPFYDICLNQEHVMLLSSGDQNKLPKDLRQCLNKKIHFIKLIQQQTDPNLGDCSYLDTCHKLSSCRYVHYKQLDPLNQDWTKIDQHNNEIEQNKQISDFTLGDPIGDLTRRVMPAQWINCDIRKLDFNKLGKFAAVIADPPWNIHMNLPYGTCNDSELLNLPMSQLQDEGILLLWVTGRSIEIGRESFIKWGYRVVDEIIWIKTNQLNRTICTGRTGHWLNHSKEHLLVGVKGNPKWAQSGFDTDIIVSATRETSRKPDEVYDIVERIVGTKCRKLEIFGRDHNTRPGWISKYLTKILENYINKSSNWESTQGG